MLTAYLAGPDVFLPNPRAQAARKIEICARHGIVGRTPLNEDIARAADMTDKAYAMAIFRKDMAMMEACDIVIANLTPFRGASADAGTLVEIGWFLGRGRKVFGYSNDAALFTERSRALREVMSDPLPGIVVEGFGLPDNLMIPGAVLAGGGVEMVVPPDGRDRAFDALDVFEICVGAAARLINKI